MVNLRDHGVAGLGLGAWGLLAVADNRYYLKSFPRRWPLINGGGRAGRSPPLIGDRAADQAPALVKFLQRQATLGARVG